MHGLVREANTESEQDLSKKIHVILSNKKEHQYTSKSFLNALEMATFDIGNESLTFEISTYINDEDLNNLEDAYRHEAGALNFSLHKLTRGEFVIIEWRFIR